jgi:DNA helicase-2/ATP-dependent DNA helicase PcrA
LIEKIISESGILFNALTADDKNWNMQLLNTFFDFVKAECSRNSKTQLGNIIQTLDLMETEGVSLPAERLIYSDDGVNFITTHSSKGLEFEYVFVMGCTSRAWEKSSNNFDFKLPDTLFDIHSKNDIEEVRRLFYVAMTRAKRQLQISYAERDENEKEIEKSCFVAELESHGNLEIQKCIADADSLIEFEKHVLAPLPASQNKDLFNNTFVDELLQKYTLSVTHLNKYLYCPTAFYFENFIKVPSPKSASATFGSAVHYALERLFKNMNASETKQFADVEEVVKDFKWFIRRNEDSFTEMEYKRRLEYGEKIIPAYYNRYIHEWNKITSIERQMRNVVVDGVPLNGKLDKLEFDGNFVNVVDYKTGKYENAKKKFKRPDQDAVEKAINANKEPNFEDQYGGDYWRQAVFYKILLDYDKTKSWECRSSEFDFIEPNKDSGEFFKEKVAIVPSDMEVVRQQITESYAKISQKEFAHGCGKEDCKWCNFTQEYYK